MEAFDGEEADEEDGLEAGIAAAGEGLGIGGPRGTGPSAKEAVAGPEGVGALRTLAGASAPAVEALEGVTGAT